MFDGDGLCACLLRRVLGMFVGAVSSYRSSVGGGVHRSATGWEEPAPHVAVGAADDAVLQIPGNSPASRNPQ